MTGKNVLPITRQLNMLACNIDIQRYTHVTVATHRPESTGVAQHTRLDDFIFFPPYLEERLIVFHLGFELVAHFDIYLIVIHFQYRQSKEYSQVYRVVKVFFLEVIIGEALYCCTWHVSRAVKDLTSLEVSD